MSNTNIVEDLKNYVTILMKKDGISNYDLKVEGQSEIGENFTGDVVFFEIRGENEAKNEKKYNLVLKLAKYSENFPVDTFYSKEIFMYTRVFPAFQELCQNKISIDFIPKIYHFIEEPKKQIIILENLKSLGYKLHDRKKPWNLKHSLLTMKNYGKYHALSFALNDKNPEAFKDLTTNLTNMSERMGHLNNLHKMHGKYLKNVINLLKEIGRKDLADKFDGLIEKQEQMFIKNSYLETKVITHGDCWNNNFMFKYEDEDLEESTPSKMILLDFQISAVVTPIFDLSYNIYTSCDKENLDNFDLLMKTYHQSLTETLKNLGCSPNLYTFDKLMKDWREYAIYGLLLSPLVLTVELAKKGKAKGIEGAFSVEVEDEKEYNRRVLEVFIHFGDHFYN